MSEIAIHIESISKQYRIGGKQEGYKTLRDTLTNAFVAPFRRAARLLQGQATGAAELNATIWALKDVSFEIKRGEVVGIIGRNGAGKSTLLKILTRITEPTEGYAEIHGRVGSLLEVGTGFHPELTGRENIYLNGAILGMKRTEIERKFDEIVAFAEVEKFIDTPVKHYSSGMYLRLAFAVAAHLEPEILLVDEVLAVGDAAFQKKCLGKMGEVARGGRTVLFVSHNMRAVSNLTQHCIWLEGGRIAANEKTDWVITEYMSWLNTNIPNEGWADLSDVKRHSVCRLRKARFEWVRLLDSKGGQTGRFLEGEPITVELGFQVMQQVQALQFGCSVMTVDGSTSLFTVPSSEFCEIVEPGNYSVRVHINPNCLRYGDYMLALKLFADGLRQDTIGEVIGLNIKPNLSSDDNPAYAHKWVAGYMRFDYKWGGIERNGIFHLASSKS
jgi:lipopolysaccharide transport system ATP-binding protein